MVQIIRDQMRNYTPDMSKANRLASEATTYGEWANAFKKMGSIAGQIGQEQAKSEALAAKQQKEAEQAQKLAQTEMENADTTMIDTQIGNMPQTELMRWNVEQIQAGVDPTTPEYSQKLIAKREEIYRPFIENMQTQKGRDKLMKQGLDTQERLRQSNLGKIAENRKKALAQAAFADSAKTQAQEARDFGKNGDWKGYQDASKDTRKAMADYIAAQAAAEAAKMQAAGIDPQAVIESQQLQAAQAKLDATKADAKQMQADIDALRNKVYQDVEKVNPNASEKQKEKVFKDLYPEEAKAYPKTKKQKGNVEVLKRREFVPGLLEEINDLGIDEDEAQINFFDRIDVFRDKGMSEDEAIQTAFDANPGNKFGDVDTLKRIYEKYSQGEILEFTKLKKKDFAPGLLDKLNNMGIDEDVAQLNFFDRIDELKSKGMKEEKAIQAIFEANPNNKFGDVSTLKDFYDMYQGRYSDSKERPTEQEVVATAKQKSKAKPKKTKTRQQVATDVAVQKKLMKGGDDSKQAAEYIVDTQSMQSYMSGLAEEDPQKAIMMLGDKDTVIKAQKEEAEASGRGFFSMVADAAKYVMPGLGIAESVGEVEYSKNLDAQGRKDLEEVIPDAVKQIKSEVIVDQAQKEQGALKDRLKTLVKGSDAYKLVEKQIQERQAIIDDPTDKVIDSVREDLSVTVLPEARKSFETQRLQQKEMAQQQFIETRVMTLSPDKTVANEANLAIAFGQQPAEEMLQMSIAPEEIDNAWERYYENDNKVKFNTTVTVTGTKDMLDAMENLVKADPNNPAEGLMAAYNGFVAVSESAGLTQKQKNEYKNTAYRVLQDKEFRDLYSSVLQNRDRYYPDNTWFENIGDVNLYSAPSTINPRNPFTAGAGITYGVLFGAGDKNIQRTREQSVGQRLEEMGLAHTAKKAQDKDSVKAFLDTRTVDITNTAGTMLSMAALEEDPARRQAMAQNAVDYYVTEKRKAFDDAMGMYGIDMSKLREVYNQRGYAVTQIGNKWVKYVGDDASTGLPQFEKYEEERATKSALERLNDAIKNMF